ncbi:amino acid adenylation domain-containing protein [Streptomyces sp. NPDC001137]|uniref:amino acid adenylation domain-containing protein n=1 Tax=Streptomyces sp. NPDC001137 TaxID=3154378 RepID=UPI00331C5FA3
MTSPLSRLFLEQARRCPDAPAVISEHEVVTYGELARSARRIAGALAARGVGRESIVGVLIAPGPDLVAALLGVWLAGGCYLPLDPLAPAKRLDQVLALADAALVIADERWSPRRADPGRDIPLCRVAELTAGDFAEPAHMPSQPRQAAYMIFTSGSTGTPKGVVIEHQGLANTVLWRVGALELSPADRVLQKTPLTFDAAQWEIFAPLVCGASVAFGRPEAGRDARALVQSVRERRATVVQVVPTMLRLLTAEPDLAACTSLRVISSGGEQLRAELCQRVRLCLDVEIWNTYGPTECSIEVMATRFDPAQHDGPVPIGRPIADSGYLLTPPADGGGEHEAVHELYVRGPGVGRGYYGDPVRTAQRFLPDPLGPPGARVYRTGDLVRERADGALEFVGRVDAQTKINGIRIEPGEVEAALEAHQDVVEAAVRTVTDPQGVKKLAAWVVVVRAGALDELVPGLRDTLPPALVPAIVTGTEALPRTSSGKTDYARLPEPDWAAGAEPDAPGTRLTVEERIVLSTWRELLGVDEVGLDDDFFRLGGHSLMMTRLAALLAETSGLTLEFRDLLYAATAREQARLLSNAARERPIPRLPEGARLPLSYGQERFWVLDRMNPGSREYLLPLLIRLPVDVPSATVEQALACLVARHEALRTRCVMDAEGLSAVVEPAVSLLLNVLETPSDEIDEILAAELALGFDLGVAPLCRATLVRGAGQEQLLLLMLHHIVCDGWSAGLLERDLAEFVDAIGSGRTPRLPSLPLSYADAVAWQRAELTDEAWFEELGYWSETLAGLPALEPPGRTRGRLRSSEGAAVDFCLPAEVVSALLETGRRAGATPFVVFLTLWTAVVARTHDQWDFGVGAPHARRSRPELHDIVGLFINVVVIRSRLTPHMTFMEALAAVERVCREGFVRSAVPFEAVAEATAPERDLSRTPLFQTMVTVGDDTVGQRMREEDLPRLRRVWSTARTDLALTLWPYDDGRYGGALEYASALYDEAEATDLVTELRTLAERFATDPELRIGADQAEEKEHRGHRSAVRALVPSGGDPTPGA